MGVNILVIEDNEQMRNLLRHILLNEGFEVLEAANGLDAEALAAENDVALAITDIIMPGKEGFETIIDLKERCPGIKIIAISGGSATPPEEYLRGAVTVGADATLTKPIRQEVLMAKVRELLSAG